MKSLTLIRHAKSSWDNPSEGDFDRPLNERGLRDAPVMGSRLAELNPGIGLLVSSPARRALTTTEFIADAIGYPKSSIRHEPGIYEASAQELLELIRSFPEESSHVAMVGHNPGFTDVGNLLSNASIANLPTCAVLLLEMEAPYWRDAGPATAKLVEFDFPKSGRK